jgi:hypothetical protein
MGLSLGRLLVYSINMRGEASGDRHAYAPIGHHVKP